MTDDDKGRRRVHIFSTLETDVIVTPKLKIQRNASCTWIFSQKYHLLKVLLTLQDI